MEAAFGALVLLKVLSEGSASRRQLEVALENEGIRRDERTIRRWLGVLREADFDIVRRGNVYEMRSSPARIPFDDYEAFATLSVVQSLAEREPVYGMFLGTAAEKLRKAIPKEALDFADAGRIEFALDSVSDPPEGLRSFAKNRELPRPYMFEPPEDTKMEYAPGETMTFGFTVVGRAVNFMPYFVFASSKMGEVGIGRLRAKYELERVVATKPLSGERVEVFDGDVVKNTRLPTVWDDAVEAASRMDAERLRVEFLTPTHVKFRGEFVPEAPAFAALVQSLLIRLPMLSAVHCGQVWEEDFRSLVTRAGEVKTVRDHTTWASFRRHSTFRNKTENLEGVVGEAVYSGPIAEFLPLLRMGELSHVGKRVVFGLGRYRLAAPPVR